MEKLFALSSIGLVTGIAGTVLTAQQVDAVPAGAQMAGEQGYSVTDFQSVTAVGPNAVVISVGAAPSVRASGGQEALDLYEVVVEDGEFKIQPKDENSWVGHRPRLEPGTYYVTVPRLSGATLTGSGDMSVDRVDGGKFSATVPGSGTLDIGALAVDDARFTIAGSGDLTARGAARTSHISIAGSGDAQARGVASDAASISIAGSGDAALTVNGNADVSIVGSGDVDIGGSASCAVSRMGSGKVRCDG